MRHGDGFGITSGRSAKPKKEITSFAKNVAVRTAEKGTRTILENFSGDYENNFTVKYLLYLGAE